MRPLEERLPGTAAFEAKLIDFGLPEPAIVALIWATVEIDRAASDLGLPGEELADDPHLGARVYLTRPESEPAIALVEPITEGWLAAMLARFGEGLAGAYVAWPGDFATALDRVAAAGSNLTRVASGPFGRSALVVSGPGANFVIVETPPATIDP